MKIIESTLFHNIWHIVARPESDVHFNLYGKYCILAIINRGIRHLNLPQSFEIKECVFPLCPI